MKRLLLGVFLLVMIAAGAWWGRSRVGATAAASQRSLATAQLVPRAFYGRRLEPQSAVLHGAGQSDEESFANYTAAVAPAKPMLTMKYVDLRDDLPAFFAQLAKDLARHREFLVPQIGVSLNRGSAAQHYEAETAQGVDDARIAALCAAVRGLERPMFLRVGYEFNAPWNGYEAAAYRAAFERVAAKMHACSPQVAMVWDWSPRAELDRGESATSAAARWAAYLPSEGAVDWWGVNLFRAEEISSGVTKAFLQSAAGHRVPVMIAEATPRGSSVTTGQASVDAWFAPLFGLVRASAGVKAICYIDWDWSRYPQWADWGDGRIEANDVVMEFVRTQVVGNSLYANAANRAATMQVLRVP